MFDPPDEKERVFPNWKISVPSKKNGRLSSKNVSKADRFKFAGSASTCPKSGKIVPVKVKFEPTPILRSTPRLPEKLFFSQNGLLLDQSSKKFLPAKYGSTSIRFFCFGNLIPVRSPNCETNPLVSIKTGSQKLSSPYRAVLR